MTIQIGLPMIFVSITAASYGGIEKSQTDRASALINLTRNVGGSMEVSLPQNILAYRSQFHQSRLSESTTAGSPGYPETMQYFALHGTPRIDAQGQATARIRQPLATRTAFFADIDVFRALCLVSASAVPLAMVLIRVARGGEVPAGH